MPDLPLAVAYLRMSTDKQEMSISDQTQKLNPWAAGRYRVVETYTDEGKSGSKNTSKRIAFLRMINDLCHGKHRGKVRHIIAVDKSRFDRLDSIDGAEFKGRLRDAGVKLDTVVNGLIDWTTTTGRIVDTVVSEANHGTSLLIAEKGLAGRIRVTKEGRPNQQTPYGMAKLVSSPTGETITVKRGQTWATPKTWQSKFTEGDKQEADAVRYLFTTYATQDISYSELSRGAEARGFPPPGAAGEWHADSITWMLSNPVYAGGLRIGVMPRGKFFQVRGDGKETATGEAAGTKASPVLVWGTHTGIIDRKLFDAVQQKIARKFKARTRSPRGRGLYALSGLVLCGNCGRPMYAARNEQGRTIYRCHRGEISTRATCGYWIAYESDLLPIIMGQFLDSIREEITRELAKTERPQITDEGKQLRKQLKALDKKIINGNERFLEAPAAMAKGLQATLSEWLNERDRLARQIDEADHANRGQGGKLLDWWNAYSREFFDSNPIDVGQRVPDSPAVGVPPEWYNGYHFGGDWIPGIPDPGIHAGPTPDGNGLLVVKTKIPAAVLREKLNRIGTEISVWFTKRPTRKGYTLDKVRITAAISGAVCYEWASKATS